jgi:SAM-dependent methyltransferase
MSLRHHEIAEGNHRILNPLSEARLRLIGEIAGVVAGTRALDLACGKGELLCRWAAWFGSAGVGVDISPVFLAAAVTRAAELGVADRVTFLQGDAGTYEPDQGAFGVACCIGATWIGGGLLGTIDLLRPAIAPGGGIVIGEPFWTEPPPPEALEELGFGPDDYASLEDTLDRFEAADLELVEMVLADGDSWDRYEASQWRAVADWLAANPGDADHDAMRDFLDRNRRTYLRWGRRYLGWGVFVTRPR